MKLVRKSVIFNRMASSGLSGARLASISGKSQPYVSQLLGGKSTSPVTAKSIADALQCEVLEIFEIKIGVENDGK